MLPTKPIPPRKGILSHLQKIQKEIEALPTYIDKVKQAKQLWQTKKKSKSQKATFDSVEKALQKIVPGQEGFCSYCEAQKGDNIEHIYPRGLFPEKAFVWENFLWTCSECNGSHKVGHFQVFKSSSSSEIVELKIDNSFVQPPNEDAVFINPNMDNPMDYLQLNLESGLFEIIAKDTDSRAYKRAFYTLDILQLNHRPKLVLARQQAYLNYTQLLQKYIQAKEENSSKNCLLLQKTILTLPHPTVWKEMQRQEKTNPNLKALFVLANEALNWDY